MSALTGRKTYLIAAVTILGSVASALSGAATWKEALPLIVPALLAATVRHGIGAGAVQKAAPLVVAALALSAAGCSALTPSSASSPQAPVAQAGGIFAPLIFMAGVPLGADGQPVPITISVGHSSDGNTEGKGGSLRADQRQDNKPALGVGDSAIKALAPVLTGADEVKKVVAPVAPVAPVVVPPAETPVVR